MNVFWLSFCFLSVVCILLYYSSGKGVQSQDDREFFLFQQTYLCVYLLAVGADWLQGPYVYVLYESYGMTSYQINLLFGVGFGSSMLSGTFIGIFADQYGRRLNCVVFAFLYIGSCITKHFPHFSILLVGRVLGGMATSILFSAFESWAVCEHNKRGFTELQLGLIFSKATFFNSVISIAAGYVAQVVADIYGYVAPFDVSIIFLVVLIVCILKLWNENYGDSNSNSTVSFATAGKVILNDKKVFLLGIIQSLFESAMYVFVLKWTPLLTPKTLIDNSAIPHGIIFSSFMLSVMIGSFLFTYLTNKFRIENFMRFVLFIASFSMLTPVLIPQIKVCVLLSFFGFEICVGIFWPSFATMRGHFVPEKVRSTIMNIFRIPLNLIVLLVLLQDFSTETTFFLCTFSLLSACIAQHVLYKLTNHHHHPEPHNECV